MVDTHNRDRSRVLQDGRLVLEGKALDKMCMTFKVDIEHAGIVKRRIAENFNTAGKPGCVRLTLRLHIQISRCPLCIGNGSIFDSYPSGRAVDVYVRRQTAGIRELAGLYQQTVGSMTFRRRFFKRLGRNRQIPEIQELRIDSRGSFQVQTREIHAVDVLPRGLNRNRALVLDLACGLIDAVSAAIRGRSRKRQRSLDVIQDVARDFDHVGVGTPHLKGRRKAAAARRFGLEYRILVVDEFAPLHGSGLGNNRGMRTRFKRPVVDERARAVHVEAGCPALRLGRRDRRRHALSRVGHIGLHHARILDARVSNVRF